MVSRSNKNTLYLKVSAYTTVLTVNEGMESEKIMDGVGMKRGVAVVGVRLRLDGRVVEEVLGPLHVIRLPFNAVNRPAEYAVNDGAVHA